MFDADKPISHSAQDRLNRTLFSKYLARCMLDHKDTDSLVVGLYGGWGVGKTSIINLTIEELHAAASNMEDQEKPIVLNFSAWSYSGQQQLVYSFFRRLSATLHNVPDMKDAKRIIYLLELYVSFFTNKPIPKPYRQKRSLWQKLTFQGQEDAYGWESGRDLTTVKAELNELLRQQHRKIIIAIDNISRLYPDEITQIFQIVKSMGDYSNTIYLLAMDKENIVTALDDVNGSGGAEMLEKVVQLPFEIPPIVQQDLENIFADRLYEVMHLVANDTWDTEYWAEVYYSSLRFFFENCRDITRYVNTLSFSYSRIRDIVNPVDFFALTALEVFTPEVYNGIRDNKDLFTDLLDNVYALTNDQIKRDQMRIEEIIRRSSRLPAPIMLALFMRLFPRVRRIYQPNMAFYHSDETARALRRLCSPDLFDAYFRLSMQTGQIPTSEFNAILALTNDTTLFDQALTRLNQDDKILKFLDLLDSKQLEEIPKAHTQTIISALLDNGDLFPNGIRGRLSLDTPMRIHRIIHALLVRLPSEERFLILQNAIGQASKSIYIIIHELREQAREHHEGSEAFIPMEFRDLTSEQLSSLQKLAVSRIENWASTQRLIEHPRLLAILHAWQDWGSTEALNHFINHMVDTDKGLVSFLVAILGKPISEVMTHYVKNPAWEKYIVEIENFVPIKRIEKHVKDLFHDPYFEKLQEREQLAILIFLDLIHANTNKIIPKTTA